MKRYANSLFLLICAASPGYLLVGVESLVASAAPTAMFILTERAHGTLFSFNMFFVVAMMFLVACVPNFTSGLSFSS